MKLISGNKFKINGVDYQVTGVYFRSGKRDVIEFKDLNWDKPVNHYSMPAADFDKKVTFENYISIN